MTPDKNFRMAPRFKSMLALMKGTKENRNSWKKMFIDAQLHEEAARKSNLKSKDNEGGRSRGATAPD